MVQYIIYNLKISAMKQICEKLENLNFGKIDVQKQVFKFRLSITNLFTKLIIRECKNIQSATAMFEALLKVSFLTISGISTALNSSKKDFFFGK